MAKTMLLLLPAILALALASSTALHGCPTSCGNVTIPYPFGIGTGCFRDGFEITELSEARVELPIGWQCYNQSGVEDNFLPEIDFTTNTKDVYRISNTHNQFVVIGCSSVAWYQSVKESNGAYPYDFYVGCLSYCNDSNSVAKDSSCSGVGCCHVAIPSNLADYSVKFHGYLHASLLSFSPCSYAFLVDKDWFREANNCAEAKQDMKAYGCQSTNSICYESSNGPGYLCNCSEGYHGNAYVVNGCVDIDECSLPDTYLCNGICHNMPGSYDCTCPWGKHGEPFNGSCTSKFSVKTKLAIGINTGVIVLIIIGGIFCIFQTIRLRRKTERLLSYQQLVSQKAEIMKIFTKKDLVKITNKFRTVIGHGGQGKVYLGKLEDERVVAVKVSHIVNENQKKEFVNEMTILSQVIHKNIVRLLGCCVDGKVPMLVYEFITKGSLYNYLHNNQSPIDLETRLRICSESAEALAYMHSSTDRCILHGDVKSANILLNENCTVKVSDFGASRFLLGVTQYATFVIGTNGYIDPQFHLSGRLTEKSDVYSFGVVMLELITRKKPVFEDGGRLAPLFVSAMRNNDILNILDRDILSEDHNLEILRKVGELAGECLRERGEERPRMKEVARRLEEIRPNYSQIIEPTTESSASPTNSFHSANHSMNVLVESS